MKSTNRQYKTVSVSCYVSLPFLHLTVGLTGVVDKSGQVAHAVAIYHSPPVHVETVVVRVVGVLLCHAATELLLAHYLTQVLQDDAICAC